MGKLSDIENAANGILPYWAAMKLNPRGIPNYVDQGLTGDARFSRKTGTTVGIIVPDVEVALTESVSEHSTSLAISRALPWYQLDGIIQIGQEKLSLIDYDSLSKTLTVQRTELSYSANTSIFLWSVPMLAVSSFIKGSKTIQVRSKVQITIGDVFAFWVNARNVFKEIECVNVIRLADSLNDYPLTYEIELEQGLPFALTIDELFQMRAYPAYFSEIKKIGTIGNNSKNIGPFLLDFHNGKLTTGKSIPAFFSVQLYDKFKNKLKTSTPFLIPTNYGITDQTFRHDFLLFWDLMVGKFKNAPNNVILVCDAQGQFGVTTSMSPNLPAGNSWKLTVRCDTETKINFQFEPNDWQSFTIPAFTATTITVQASPLDIKRLTITASSAPNAEISMTTWQLIEPEVEKVSCSFVAHTQLEAEWASTGLILKPFFISLDYLLANYDNNQFYDSGLIHS